METKNTLGLNPKNSLKIASKLNELLATYSVFYQNARGYHWNIKGKEFFQLHEKFEELYKELYQKIDDVAERIVTLGGTPYHNFSDNISVSKIKESKDISDSGKAVGEILESYSTILGLQRDIFALADKLNDVGTNTLMSDYITQQEKTVWMYGSYLS